jgi:hypothetical protein
VLTLQYLHNIRDGLSLQELIQSERCWRFLAHARRSGVCDGEEAESCVDTSLLPLVTAGAQTAVLDWGSSDQAGAATAAMSLLPKACKQALAIPCGSGGRCRGTLVLGTVLRGAGVWNAMDTAWMQRLARYLLI